MEAIDVLRAAREWLSDESHWTQEGVVVGFDGEELEDCDEAEAAVAGGIAKTCAVGSFALAGELDANVQLDAIYALGFTGPVSMGRWNDDPNTTHADVLARFDAAIASLEADRAG